MATIQQQELPMSDFVMVPETELISVPNDWAGWSDDLGACFVCGRKVGKKPAAWIHIVAGYEILPAKYDDGTSNWDCDNEHEDGDSDMGCWPIGPECAKKARAEGLVE